MVFLNQRSHHWGTPSPIPHRRTPNAERLQVLEGLLALRFDHGLRGVGDEVHAEAFLQGLRSGTNPGGAATEPQQGMDKRGWNLAKSWEKPLEMEL